MPTETVYGLAADATNPVALRKIFAIKGRPEDHPLILHLHPEANLGDWVEPDPRIEDIQDLWPGPLTVVLKRTRAVLDEVTGGRDTVAVRLPAHPIAQQLLEGRALAAPSANRFGGVSPTAAAHVEAEFSGKVPVVDGGPCQVGIESTIVDLSGATPALLRPGIIPRSTLEQRLGPLGQNQTVAPGTLARHYAPRTALVVTDDVEAELASRQDQGWNIAVLRATDGATYAQRLYAELRRLDETDVDLLIAERCRDSEHAEAINDRLGRAAH